MKAPKFWTYGSNRLSATCLSPLAFIYEAVTAKRPLQKPSWHAPVPVICIGNLIMGGAGKTPTAIAVAQELIAKGKKPFFLSRGYGGSLKGPVIINTQSATEVGDEPLLLAKTAPVCVSSDRIEGAKVCVEAGCDIIIMDDGYQNPSLHKDISILVIDGGYGHGNEKIFPAGPLRESMQNGLKRAQACIIIGVDKTQTVQRINKIMPDLPILQAHIEPIERSNPAPTKVLAFAGIGRPEKFFNTLDDLGCEVVMAIPFADHHFFSKTDIKNLQTLAQKFNAQLITTEKDWLRLPADFKNQVNQLKIMLEWDNKDMLNPILHSLYS